MNSRLSVAGLSDWIEGRLKSMSIFIALLIQGFGAWGQTTSVTSIPEVDENGEIHVCLGSVVLFSHDTPESQLVGATDFNWDFDYNDETASTAGPHAILFDSFGSYEVSLSIITYDGDEDLGEVTMTVVVDEAPPMIPTLGPGNPCTFTDTLYDDTGAVEQIIFQTQNGEASCTCFNDNVGPAVSMLDTDEYPDQTISNMWWGGAGTAGPNGTGGTAPYTTENGPFPLDDPAIFNGQNVFGHYADQGSYNLMHVVEFPNGCTHSSYYVMSWGAAEIDFGSSQAQSVCFPLEYPLGFDIQSPGTTYQIEWGDGGVDEYVYPDLPVLPNEIGHQYAPSCDSIGEAEAYTITVRASNACTVDTTITTQGPFYVSTPPTPDFEMIPGDVACQFDTIVFSELVQAGFEASGGSCSDDHTWEWWIEGGNDLVGEGYEVIVGGMGDIFNLFDPPVSGTEQIEVYFDEPGYYTVTLSVLNDFCNPTSISNTVLINPVPQVDDLELTICNFSGFDTLPGPPNVVPPGTIFDWTVQPNSNVEGDSNGSGTSIYADQLINMTNFTQTVIYDVIPTAPGDCVGEPFMVTVDVVPGIEISDYTVVVCNGGELLIDPANTPGNIVPDGTTFEWTVTDNPNINGESASSGPQEEITEDELTTSVIQPAQFVEYNVTAAAGFGCDDDSFMITAYVNDVDAGMISEDQLICPGGDPFPLGFTQSAVGSGTSMTYQWQQASAPNGPWTNINFQTSTSYDPLAGILDDTYYRVVVTSTLLGVSCTDVTNVVQVQVNSVSQPEIAPDQVFCAGDDPSVIELVSPIDAFGEVTYQWQSAISPAGPWNNIPGQTNENFDPPPLNNDLYVRVVVASIADDVECALVSVYVHLDVNAVNAGTLGQDQTICAGDIPETMTVNTPYAQGAISFQWYSSSAPEGVFEAISGAVQSIYQPASGLFEDVYYQVEVFSEFDGLICSDWTNSIWVQVNNVDNGAVPFVQHVCEGGDPSILQFLQMPEGDGNLTYQWQSSTDVVNWTNISGATTSSYDPPSGLEDDTEYQVLITSTVNGVECTIASQLFQVNVMSLEPGTISEGQQICAGGDPDPLFTDVPPSGEGALFYQWQETTDLSESWVDIPGANGLNYNPPGPVFETTFYQLVVTNTIGVVSCTEFTEPVFVEVNDDPEFLIQPLAFQEICVGGAVDEFEVLVEMEPWLGEVSYQWYDDNGFILNAIDSTYAPPEFSSVGTYEFYVEVNWLGEGCDGLTSDIVAVEVVPDLVVSIGPSDASYCQGAASNELDASAVGGLGTASYQWYVNATDSNQDGTLLLGETNSVFSPPTDVIGAFYYYCVVDQSVSGCEGTSGALAIEVTPGPSITSDFMDQEVCVGGTLQPWTVSYVDGTGNPSYQWYVNSSSSMMGASPIAGEVSGTYTPSSLVAGTFYYTCEISFDSGGCGEIYSPFVTVIVAPDPQITTQPLDGEELCVGGTLNEALYIAYSEGSGTPTYQWYLNGSPIANSNSAGYQPPIFDAAGSYFYEVELSVSGLGCEVVSSNEVEVIVYPDPTVVDQPISATYCMDVESTDLVISVEGGIGTFEYQWWVNDVASISGAQVLPGETATAYTPTTDQVGTFYFFCEITQTEEGCGVFSELAQIIVVPTPVVSSQPMSDSVCVNGFVDALFVEFEEGVGTPTYQWFSNSIPSMAGATQLTGETGPAYTPPTDAVGTTWYTVVLNFSEGGCGSLTADWVDVVVTPSPVIVLNPLETDTVCVGGSLLLPLDVAYDEGTGEASYQWYTGDGAEIAGASEAMYLPPGFDVPGTFEFYVQISLDGNGCAPAVSQIAGVVVVDDPVVTLEPLDSSYCQFAALVIPLEVAVEGGSGTYSYQWYESSTAGTTGGDPIPGAASSTYVPPVDVVGTLYYYCAITQSGANCEVVSDYAAIVTNEAPEFTMTLVDQEVCLDGSLDAYTVTYTNGTGAPSYQWYSNTVNSTLGGTLLTDETSSAYQPLSDAVGATWYYCEVSFSFGGCDMITSTPVLVNVVADPVISLDPLATDTLCVGGSPYLPLEVAYAEGTGTAMYQWFLGDGTAIGGATAFAYVPPSYATPGTYTYYAEVTLSGSGCDVAQSAEAEAVVVDDPVVTLEPLDSSYCQFAALVIPLEVAVEGGSGTYSYQWYESSTAGTTGGDPIPGAASSTYVPPVDVVGTLYYYCAITQSGANCEVVSDYAAIVTNEAPEFTMTLVDQEVCLDGSLDAYTVTYTNGTGAPSYQWYSNTVNSTLGGTLLTDETSSAYQPLSDAVGATWYYCEVSFSFGGCDMITSTPVLVNVVADPVISLDPLATDTLCVGGSPYLPLEVAYAEGTGTAMYQWFLGDGTAIGGATAFAYVPPSYATPGTYTYYAEVTLSGSGCDVAQSAEAEAVVVDDPVVTLEPLDSSYCQFAALVIPLEVAVEGGSGTYSYQWYESSTAGTTGGDPIPGAASSTYVPPVDVVGTLYYYCAITQSGANCEVVSDYAAIVTNEAPEFTMTLVDQEVCLDGSLDAYTVTYTNGTGAPSYQWYSNTVNSTLGGTLLTDETSSAYQPLSDAVGATWYYCEVSFSFGGCDMITSTPVLVNVVADPVISLDPLATDTLCVGGSPYLPLEVAYAEGTGTAMYQWFLGDGTAIGGATAFAYVPPSYATPGTYTYYAEVTLSGSGCDVAQSAEAEAVVVDDPVVTLEPLDSSYCQFAALVIPLEVAVEGGSGTYSYQWYESSTAGTTGGDPIPGAASSTYVPPVDVVGTLYYYCAITQSGANCEVVSDYAAIVTNEAPEFTTQPLAQTLCSGEAPNLLEVAYQYGTGIPSYQWYENTVSNFAGTPILGATNPSFQPLGAAPGSLYYYCVITFDGGGCDQITSVIAGIHVNNIVIGSIEADQAICSGEAPEAFLQNTPTTGGGALFYQWLEGIDGTSDLNEIPGAISDGYAAPALFDTTYYLLEVSSVLNTVACIDTTNAVAVIVYPLPEISIGLNDVYCVNDGIQELTEFSPIGGVWEGPGIADSAVGLFEVDGAQTGVGEWDLFFWYEDLVTGCRDTLDHEVTVNPMPTAAFEVPALACNNFPIDIDQNSIDASIVAWDFGNGDGSDDILPVYTFPDPGVYTIELIAENGFGCLDTSFSETEITYLPQADFSLSDNEGCAPFVIEIINLSDAPFSTHEWMLGDSLFEGISPDSTLFEQGPDLELYDVVLSVSNVCGTTSETQNVSVIPVPQMSFLLLEDTACSPFTPDILNTSVGLPNQIDWDFGNGQTESGTITNFPTYFVDPDSSATTFFITVVGTNECGTDSSTAPIVIQPNTIQAFFAVDQDEGCAPLAVSATDLSFETTEFIFDFGNGQVSYDQESSTLYEDPGTYIITQYVTNGCSLDTTYYQIEVWPQPDYTLSSDQPNYCEGETVSLTLSSAEPTSVVWQFGQGDSDTGLNVSTVYANDGIYTVNAEVTSGINGCVANGTLPVTILPTPELAIDSGLEGGCSPLSVSFENNSSDADFWNWDFGDGEESGVTAPNHTFVNSDQEPVDYTITVYASNIQGCEATTQLDLTVLPAPEAGMGGIEDQYCGVPASVYPENLSQYAIDYQWEVDGQLVSTAFEPDLTFESSGVFALELTALNEYDCPTTANEIVVVHVNPIPALNLSPLDGCPPLDVYLQDASVVAVSELTITYEEEVVYEGPPTTNYYLFEWSGIYTLGLEVTSADGCTVNEPNLEVITVHPEPFALFEMVPYDAGSGPDIPSSLNTQWTFLNLSNDNSLNYWQFGDGAVSTEFSPTHKYSDPGVYGVSLLVTNDFGCNSTYSDWVVLEEQTPVYVPNSFTPGGVTSRPDGLNDAFRAEFRDYELITDYSLQIFDRWGELIWESSDPEEFWLGNVRRDGYESEHFVKLDVYTWKIRYSSIAMKGTHRELTGHVTIVR